MDGGNVSDLLMMALFGHDVFERNPSLANANSDGIVGEWGARSEEYLAKFKAKYPNQLVDVRGINIGDKVRVVSDSGFAGKASPSVGEVVEVTAIDLSDNTLRTIGSSWGTLGSSYLLV